jgi:hypothetical protein
VFLEVLYLILELDGHVKPQGHSEKPPMKNGDNIVVENQGGALRMRMSLIKSVTKVVHCACACL